MSEKRQEFFKTIERVLNEKEARNKISNESARYFSLLNENKNQFADFETALKRAAFTRWKTIENLDKYLIEFEANFIKRGGKLIWALDAKNAVEEISVLIKNSDSVSIQKNKHGIISEIQLDKIIATRELSKKNSACIAEANFLSADPGAICVMDTDEIFISAKKKIVVAGIDRMIPSLNDLDLFLSLQSVYQFQSLLTAVNQIYFGPSPNNDDSSFNELILVLVDNGRSKLMSDEIARQALWCTGCGACRYTDVLFRTIGKDVFPSYISGTVAAAQLPYRDDFKNHFHLAEAQPLDGYSSEVCPVGIDFNKIFLHARKQFVENKMNSKSEKWFYFFWKKAMLKRSLINLKGVRTTGYFVNILFNKSEKGLRTMREPAAESFNQLWRKRMKI